MSTSEPPTWPHCANGADPAADPVGCRGIHVPGRTACLALGNRFTGERFEKALNVTLNSVVFRSSGQDLTTAGTYIEMTSRLTEPVLLGLAVLAVRNRVKR
ncbi:hypothetical protein ACF1G0_32865 [Streptomyces sp. NPDC013953]|uniref:hypothetical protein n=1 Tax=Streptomyces sp. NPDC013953 TaxID=3364868 RepID=UPI0036F8AB3F